MHRRTGAHRGQHCEVLPRAGATDGWKLPLVGTGNKTQIFAKSNSTWTVTAEPLHRLRNQLLLALISQWPHPCPTNVPGSLTLRPCCYAEACSYASPKCFGGGGRQYTAIKTTSSLGSHSLWGRNRGCKDL